MGVKSWEPLLISYMVVIRSPVVNIIMLQHDYKVKLINADNWKWPYFVSQSLVIWGWSLGVKSWEPLFISYMVVISSPVVNIIMFQHDYKVKLMIADN